jgi:glycerol-3-phosphate acyltransferase PlsY
VSGSITAGTLASRVLGETDMRVFNSDAAINLDGDEQVA